MDIHALTSYGFSIQDMHRKNKPLVLGSLISLGYEGKTQKKRNEGIFEDGPINCPINNGKLHQL